MTNDSVWAPMLVSGLFALVCLWAAFWLIRLAVRYGVNDALRMNRSWLTGHEAAREHELNR